MDALSKIQAAGFVVALVGDRLDVTPTRTALTESQRDYIKEHRADIVSQLSKTKTAQSNELLQDIREQIEERAAIMEYDGGLPRHDAEQAATRAIRVYCYRTTEKPEAELTVIMPNTELDEATANLKNRLGDKLLSVYPMVGTLASSTKH